MIEKGNRVAWSHEAYVHTPRSVIYVGAAPEGSVFGTVVGPANDSGSWLEVQLDGEDDPRVLTIDELVMVDGETEGVSE